MSAAKLALAVLSAAAVAACGTSSSHAASKPLTCVQQYHAWIDGPAGHLFGRLGSAADKASAASDADDVPRTIAALELAATDARAAAADLPPRCADPAGYYRLAMTDTEAAGDNAGTSTGMSGLTLAQVPWRRAEAALGKLHAELKRTVG